MNSHLTTISCFISIGLKGSVLRMSCVDGPQAGDVNFWNAKNYKEHFFTGKTRQLHRSHLSLYDKLWSCFPYLNPMATIVGDSIQYGLDDGKFKGLCKQEKESQGYKIFHCQNNPCFSLCIIQVLNSRRRWNS